MIWIIYLLIAIVLMSVNAYVVKLLVKNINPLIVLFYQYLIAIPLLIIYSLMVNADLLTGNFNIVLLGFLYVTGIALFYIALKKGSLSKVSPVFNLKMIITAILGIIVLSEPLTLNKIVGLLFGILSVYLLSGEEV
ncbi:hypothetical protein COS64_03420 [archaeon CG06_land_8_20_14_3_00_37_11]|nr:MAG: hypothetical protein COS64_03420 [archaeon CG06_land_8_20_14_3_00_37_11]